MYSPDHKHLRKWCSKDMVVWYGALANKYFMLFNIDMARAITMNGRYFIRTLGKNIEEGLQDLQKMNSPYVIYHDTDSAYFKIDNFVNQAFKDKPDGTIQEKTDFCDNFYNSIVDKFVQKTIDDVADELHAHNKDAIGSEREIIADTAIWVAKKKYAARVIDSEGVRYKEPKLKIMGLEIVRSSTPVFVQKKLKNAVTSILDSTEDEIIKYKDAVLQEFMKEPLENIARVQGVSNIDYDLKTSKSIPIGARSVIVFNDYIKKNNLEDEFQVINEGTKIKQMYLKEPNIFNSNVIAWNDDKFTRFLESVDYQKCFDKYFLSPLEIMTKPLGWNINRSTESLDEEW